MIDKVTRQCPQTTTFWRERRAEAVSNRGPSAYEPNALPLGQTYILDWRAALAIYRSSGGRWVNMHFRCRVWQAQILDVIRCHLLLEHPCDVLRTLGMKTPTYWNLQWCSCRLLLKFLYVSSAASATLNSSKGDNSFNMITMCLLCNNSNNSILYSSQQEIKAVVRSIH